jgi:hypothetical protein
MFVRDNRLNWIKPTEQMSWFVFMFALIGDQMRVEVRLVHPDPALGRHWTLLQTHINFPRFLPIFPDFLEQLSHLAPIY